MDLYVPVLGLLLIGGGFAVFSIIASWLSGPRRYNRARLHSALGYLPPAESYGGDPATRFEEGRRSRRSGRGRSTDRVVPQTT